MKKRNKNIIISLIAIIAIISFISINYILERSSTQFHGEENNTSTKSTLEESDEKQIYNEYYSPLLAVDYSKKSNLNKDSDYIAIVKIDSLESDNWDSINKQYVAVYSKGVATVINVLKGNLPNVINYKRLGGKIGYEEWIQGDVDRKKMEGVIGVPSNPKKVIINSKKAEDIDLEVGKTYLVFMKHYSCCNMENEYSIIAYEHGTRELQQSDISTYSLQNVADLKVKNNVTGEWQNISEVVNFNISE